MPQRTPSRRRRAGLSTAAGILALALTVGLVGRADAAPTTQSNAAAAYLAGLVGADGAVEDPYSGLPSVSATVQVALALVADQSQADATGRALDYIGDNVEAYIAPSGSDNPGRIGYLILLAHSTGADPTAYGSTSVDLVSRLGGTFETAETGLYGPADPYSAVFNQSIALLALDAIGQVFPASALTWLLDQQCGSGTNSEGGWQAYRGSSGGTLDACAPSDAGAYTGADSNSTSVAVQALVAVGSTAPVPAALGFLATTQTGGGFAYYVGADLDPNSTALGIQAYVAAGQDASSAFTSLESWQITSGDEAGALASPYSSGFADFLATTQGVWGLALQPFPFPVLPSPTPTSTTTAPPSTTSTAPPAAAGVVVVPAFTG